MAVAMLNKKTGDVLTLSPNDFMINLRLEPETYGPVDDAEYYVLGGDGVYSKTTGKDLVRTLGDTQGYLADKKTAEIDIAVRAENSAFMEGAKGFASELFALGLDRPFFRTPNTPEEAAYEAHRQKVFGKAENIGRMAGTISPLLFGGLAGFARGGVKKVLQAGAKTPAGKVLKTAGDAGKKATELAKKAGMGKTGQAALGAVGAGAAFAGIEAGLSAVKTGVSTYKTPIFKGDKKVRKTVTEAFQAGGKAGSETLVSTAVWMGALGGTVKGAQLLGRGIKVGAKTVFGPGVLSAESLRKSFFKIDGSEIGRQNKAILNRHLPDTPTDTKRLGVIFKTLEKVGIKGARTREGLFNKVNEKIQDLSRSLYSQRIALSKAIDKAIRKEPAVRNSIADALIAYLKVSKVSGARAVTYKEFNKTIDDLIETLKNKAKTQKLTSFDISETLSTLYKKGKLSQRTNPELKAQKLYQRAYDQVSSAERVLARSYLKDVGKKLVATKENFSALQSVKEVLENAMIKAPKQGGNLASLVIGGGGYWAGGIPGAVTGYIVPKAIGKIRDVGFNYLQLAKGLEKITPVINKVRNPLGVKSLLEKGSGFDLNLSIPGIGIMLFQRNVNSIEELNDQLNRLEDWDKTTTGYQDLFSMANDYGGKDAFNHTAINLSRVKQAVIASMPPMKRNHKGNLIYDKRDEKMFLKDLNRWVTPVNFVNALSKKQMTSQAYQKFGNLYPSFISMFNMNFHQAVREGKIKGDDMLYYKNFLSGTQSGGANLLYSMLDYEQVGQGQGLRSAPPKRKMSKPEATISEKVQGGVA